jgi:GTP-binding protein
LHLGILIETMRREGFEMSITPPQVLFRYDEHGNQLEPIEKVTIDADARFVPGLSNQLTPRGGIYLSC